MIKLIKDWSSQPLRQKFKLDDPKSLGRAAVLLSVPAIIIRGWAISGSWFWLDDHRILVEVASGKTGIQWYFDNEIWGFNPLTKFIGQIAASSSTPYNWTLAVLTLLVLNLLMFVSAWWMLKMAFGWTPLILIPFIFFVYGSMSFVGTLWWTAAIGDLVSTIAAFMTLGFAVSYFQSKGTINIFGIAVFTALGLLASEQMVLTAPLLFVIAAAYFSEGNIVRRTSKAISEFGPVWRIVLALNLLALYFPVRYDRFISDLSANPKSVLETSDVFIGKVLPTFLTGGPWIWKAGEQVSPNPSLIMVGVSWSIITLGVLITFVLNKRAIRGLWVLGIYALSATVLIGIEKGSEIRSVNPGIDSQYLMNLSAFATLTIALMVIPLLSATETLERRKNLNEFLPHARAATLIVAAFWIGAVFSSVNYTKIWHQKMDTSGKSYVQNVIEGASKKEVQLAEGIAPEEIIPARMFDLVLLSKFLAPLSPKVSVVSSGENLFTVTEKGLVKPARVENQPTHFPGDTPGCGYLISGEPTRIEFESTNPFGSWVMVGYLSGAPGQAIITSDDFWHRMKVSKGLNNYFFWVDHSISYLTIDPKPETGLCVDQVRTGPVSPPLTSAQ